MIKPMLVYKSLNPRAFKGICKETLPVFWRANKKAWVTAKLFLDWFKNCFVPEVQTYLKKKNLSNRALLIIDNAPGHPTSIKLENSDIEILFLPPNTTSLIQPLDQGLILTFKAYYTRRTFRRILEASEQPNFSGVMDCWKTYSIKECIVNIGASLKELKPSTINGCWRNIWPEAVEKSSSVPDLTDDLQEIMSIARNVGGEGFEDMSSSDIEEVINADIDELGEDNLEELLQDSESDAESEEEVEIVQKSKMTEKVLIQALEMIRESADFLFANDHNLERSIRAKREIEIAVAPYKELHKSIVNNSRQSKMTQFFSSKIVYLLLFSVNHKTSVNKSILKICFLSV
jgi:hypothetical protein